MFVLGLVVPVDNIVLGFVFVFVEQAFDTVVVPVEVQAFCTVGPVAGCTTGNDKVGSASCFLGVTEENEV